MAGTKWLHCPRLPEGTQQNHVKGYNCPETLPGTIRSSIAPSVCSGFLVSHQESVGPHRMAGIIAPTQ
jgi:hypothetical protein